MFALLHIVTKLRCVYNVDMRRETLFDTFCTTTLSEHQLITRELVTQWQITMYFEKMMTHS